MWAVSSVSAPGAALLPRSLVRASRSWRVGLRSASFADPLEISLEIVDLSPFASGQGPFGLSRVEVCELPLEAGGIGLCQTLGALACDCGFAC